MSALAASAQATVLAPLPELGVVCVTGADAVSFLQSQLTNDVSRLASGKVQLSGYCTPKGRLLATFHQWRTDEGVFMRMPREIIGSVVKRLSMFVLRAKAKVTDVSDALGDVTRFSATAPTCCATLVCRRPMHRGRRRRPGLVRVDRLLPTPDGVGHATC